MSDRQEPPVSEAMRREFATRLRARREALGLSQPGLGARLRTLKGNAVEGPQISRWERGMEFPSRRYRPQLADALEIDEASLFGVLATTGDGPLANRVDEIEEQLAALADLLGVTDDLDRAVRRRRRVRRTTSPAADEDVGEESAADLALRLGRDDPGDKAVSG